MPVSPAREAAYQILRRVESGRTDAVELLHSQQRSGLSEADRKLATELVMGVLRWRGDLDFQIETLSGKPLKSFDPEVTEILRLGVYQIRFLSAIPKPAAVNESVELVKAARKRSAAGLINAVLRKCQRPALSLRRDWASYGDEEYFASAQRSIPPWIGDRWQRNFGPQTARSLVLGSQSIPATCLRITGSRFQRENIQRELADAHVHSRPGVYGDRALWVESGNIFLTAAWQEGRVVIQDEASQLVAELVQPRRGQRVLDLCAAPGLKTGQMAEALQEGAVVACDRSPRRMQILKKLLPRRWPEHLRLHRVLLDATQPLPFAAMRFDRVLVDAPCSGTGTLARNPEIKWRLRLEDLIGLPKIQAKILRRGLESLARGGRLVYATCSLEPEENEEIVSRTLAECAGYRILEGADLRSEFPALAPLFEDRGTFRTWPGVHRLDGFFAVVLVRV